MDYQIIWSEPALCDLQNIYSFIAQDSERYAMSQIRKLFASVRRLENFPLSGRAVPRPSREGTREIVVTPYRVIYEIDDSRKRVEIKLVHHGSRRLNNL